MSTINDWRAQGIHNSVNLTARYEAETGRVGVYIYYSSNDGSRFNTGRLDGFSVERPGRKLPNESIFRLGTYRYDRSECLAAASAWARDRYKVGEFVAIPGFGRDRFPREIADWAKSFIKNAKKGAADV